MESVFSGSGCASVASNLEIAMTGAAGDWFVVRTRSRQEKILASNFRANDAAYFLPLMQSEKVYCGQTFTVEQPLFPGIVFFRGTHEQACSRQWARHIAQVVPVVDQDELNTELANLARAMTAVEKLQPHHYLPNPIRVEVRSGPLCGLRAVVSSLARRDCLIHQIHSIGQAVSHEIDAKLVRPL
jgi:hypothetical protein